MNWNIAMLLVNIALAMLAGNLFCKAPDWLQKIALGFGIVGSLCLVLFYGIEAFTQYYTPWQIRVLGLSGGYTAFLMHVIRLHLVKSGTCQNSLQHSPKHPA